ncbi:PDR/VanB family oxidoreductase [Pseudomonas sp. NPDC089401]|uniref:PDR/VanB family oxidoreductase n=1 Tax=Pseudomonas sp. NPDC089401 TaxID=3364462 RepID=UPI0037F2D5B1
MPDEVLNLQITDLTAEAKGVMVIELRSTTGQALPPFKPGAHVELHLPGNIVRQYSLCNDARETHRYCLGVGLSPSSRGGSRHVHRSLKVGDTLKVSPPRNHFPLQEDAPQLVFFAGGIGITPVWSMIQWCEANGRPWHLFYLVRNRQRAAFLETLGGFGDRVTLHADDEAGGLFDIAAAIARQPANVHIYTCGPTPLMLAVEAAASGFPDGQVHFEWFTPRQPTASGADKAFTVQLARSGRSLEVPADKSILEVLEANGLRVESSCREGTCASCEICVLEGIPEHRDSVLTAAERNNNDVMMICVSRSRSENLVLDL